jgi:hypothetical protein
MYAENNQRKAVIGYRSQKLKRRKKTKKETIFKTVVAGVMKGT